MRFCPPTNLPPLRGEREEEERVHETNSPGACPPYSIYESPRLGARTLPSSAFCGLLVLGRRRTRTSESRDPVFGFGFWREPPQAVRAAGTLRLQPRTRGPLPPAWRARWVGWAAGRGRGYRLSGECLGRGRGSGWVTFLRGLGRLQGRLRSRVQTSRFRTSSGPRNVEGEARQRCT